MSVFAKLFDKSSKKTVVQGSTQATPLNVLSTSQGKEKYERLMDKGSVNPVDLICPSSIDTRHPDCILVDGTYISTILVITYPYERPAEKIDQVFDLLEKVYTELQDTKKEVRENSHQISKLAAVIENEIKPDIKTLYEAVFALSGMVILGTPPKYSYALT